MKTSGANTDPLGALPGVQVTNGKNTGRRVEKLDPGPAGETGGDPGSDIDCINI